MIFAASSAFANRSSAFGRFRSAKTFPELGVDSRLGTFTLLFCRLACARVGAAAGSGLFLVAESRSPTLPSSEKHGARKQPPGILCQVHRTIVPLGSSARTCQMVSVKPCNIFALSC